MDNVQKIKNKKGAHLIKDILVEYPTFPIILVMVIAFSIWSPYFLTTSNFQTIMAGNAIILIAAIGETIVLLTGGIDLSIPSVISCSAVISGIYMANTGNIFVGLLIALCVGLGFGVVNGVMIGYLGMTPFITTMGTQLVAKGIALVLTTGIAVKGTPAAMVLFGFKNYFGIPAIFLIGLVLLIVIHAIMKKTSWGRETILVGANKVSARYCGINVPKREMQAYLLSGIIAGLAGFISIASLGNALPSVGDKILLVVIGGVVLGGTNMNGGEGSIARTLIGIGLLSILTSGLNVVGMPFYDQLIIQGILIFVGNGLAINITSKSNKAVK